MFRGALALFPIVLAQLSLSEKPGVAEAPAQKLLFCVLVFLDPPRRRDLLLRHQQMIGGFGAMGAFPKVRRGVQ